MFSRIGRLSRLVIKPRAPLAAVTYVHTNNATSASGTSSANGTSSVSGTSSANNANGATASPTRINSQPYDYVPTVTPPGFARLFYAAPGDADSFVAACARVSYTGAKTVSDDVALVDYLMRHRHTSPFEMVEFWFRIKCPIFVARQWHRHRTASINEISGRYVELPQEFYTPDVLYGKPKTSKQGSGSVPLQRQDEFKYFMCREMQAANDHYRKLLALGVSNEIARTILPQSQYTEFVWKCNLHNLMHFLRLRLDSTAQAEIRTFATDMLAQAEQVAPAAFASWRNHCLNAVTFSAAEMQVLRDSAGWPRPSDTISRVATIAENSLSRGQYREFMEKIEHHRCALRIMKDDEDRARGVK